ncbi:unnamed protein product [Nezara viridula]|uniref:Uncharacterized protein n=1 Tax=Nezara viridula TaxID=85310 RepID=A0A9P0HS39_NEZVI|nr:unnamed protein product [Nezara viridula]
MRPMTSISPPKWKGKKKQTYEKCIAFLNGKVPREFHVRGLWFGTRAPPPLHPLPNVEGVQKRLKGLSVEACASQVVDCVVHVSPVWNLFETKQVSWADRRTKKGLLALRTEDCGGAALNRSDLVAPVGPGHRSIIYYPPSVLSIPQQSSFFLVMNEGMTMESIINEIHDTYFHLQNINKKSGVVSITHSP